MISLFFRIFLLCLISLTLVGGITTMWRDNNYEHRFAERERELIEHHQAVAQEIYSAEGLNGLKRWVKDINRQTPFRITRIKHAHDDESSEQTDDKTPDNLTHSEDRFSVNTSEEGTLYFKLRSKHSTALPPPKHSPLIFWPMLLTLLLISAVVAGYLIAPIRQLHRDVQRWHQKGFADGINSKVAHRKDALGELANEMNKLSSKVSTLLKQQKQLLRDVSHELRSPLARIQVATELLRHPKTVNQAALFDRIETETVTLDELVGELLTLQRWQNPEQSWVVETITLQPFVQHILDRISLEAEQKQVLLKLDYQTEIKQLNVVPKPLESALENIIRNAISHSSCATTVLIHLSDLDSKTLEISVQDQGGGVDPALLSHLFEPFFRTDDARSREKGGFGVGLAIAKEGVKINQGQILAENITAVASDSDTLITGLKVSIHLPTLSA